MKRICSLLLALVLLVGLLPVHAAAAALDNGLVYEVYEDHVEITDYTGDSTEVVIPDEIEGLPVTVIGKSAFEGQAELTGITLPDSLVTICSQAFFRCSSLTSINIPDGVTSIGYGAFIWCSSLTSITLPNSLISIGDGAFEYCHSLTAIQVDIGNEVFCSQNGILYNKDMTILIKCPGGMQGSVVIPESVNGIYDSAFFHCANLTTITIPDSVIEIQRYAFSGCTSLTDFQVDIGNEVFCAQDGVLYSKDMTELVCCPGGRLGSFSIPDGVTHIGSCAFRECGQLTSISIPDSVTNIGEQAFYCCFSLANISIPDGVTSIEAYCFSTCDSLTSITIPDSVTSIGMAAFYECRELTEITIPAAVNTIDDRAFGNCSNLRSISFCGSAPEIHSNPFGGVTAECFYPASDSTWTADKRQNYGGTLTWVPYDPSNPFTDVPADSFYHSPVLWALENSITTGASETTFNPNGQCLRAQVVTFLWRAEGCPEPESTVNPFVDVKESDFYYKAVLWAVEQGITNGSDATHFNPMGVCNRAQVVTFLHRAFGSPAPDSLDLPFTDVPAGAWYEAPIAWAVENGITNGLSATEFGPNAACNRAQVVTFLYRAYN